MKFNLNALDTVIDSLIFEFTWFEVHPLELHFWTKQPSDFMALFNSIKSDMEAHIGLSYFLDFISLKVKYITYPTFCTVDLAAIIDKGYWIQCGYSGDEKRVAPLHAQDPNLYFSLMHLLLPNFFGRNNIYTFRLSDLFDLIGLKDKEFAI